MQGMYVEQSPRRLMHAASLQGGHSDRARNMTTTASNASEDKRTDGRLPFRHDSRRLDRGEIDRIAARRVRIELEARRGKTAATKPLSPAMVGTGILAGVAFVFSVMTWLNETTQDKVDKATAPLATRMTEMDRRLTDRLDAVDARIERLEVRVDKQFETVNTKLDLLLKRR